jgi:hypothetical protein
MHQQEEVTTIKFTPQDEERLKKFVSSALTRVHKLHMRRFPKYSPELYKLFISREGQKALRMGPNMERPFQFNGKRAIIYTGKPEAPVARSYASCEVSGVNRELGSQSVIFIEEPVAVGPLCFLK